MKPAELAKLIRSGESPLVELKREWWDFENKVGKATFAKDVLAMANTLTEGDVGQIVIGVEDKKAGGAVLGVTKAPSSDAVAQVLTSYTNPVPKVSVVETSVDDKKLHVIEVQWTASHPYYSVRDVDGILSSEVVYTRRGSVVSRLRPAELEQLIRAKQSRLGKIEETSALSVGFVELPMHSSDRASFRVSNLTEEPVTNINAHADIFWLTPELHVKPMYRMGLLSGLTLRPAEVREADFQLSNASFLDKSGRYTRAPSSGWFNIELRVAYRDRDGFLTHIIRQASTW